MPKVQQKFLLIIGIYFFLHIVLRITISPTLDYDEAEQALLSQWLLAGYTEQPPLYTWVQHLLFSLFGPGVFGISLLKNSLLFCTYLFVLQAGRQLLKTPILPVLASASLLLIPQIGWESQRDMTHTTLATCSAAATLWLLLRLLRKRQISDYVFLGIGLGVGFLSKANYLGYLVLLFPVFLSYPDGRRILFSPRILISCGVALLLASPFFWWLVENRDIALSASHKLHRPGDNPLIQGFHSFFQNGLLFLLPYLVITLLVFKKDFYGNFFGAAKNFPVDFFRRYLLLFFLLMCCGILLLDITYVKDRWLQPILFLFPLFCFAHMEDSPISQTRVKFFAGICCTVAVTIYIVFTLRVAGAPLTDSTCRLNYPIPDFAAEIKKAGFDSGLILSDNRFLAGNLRLHFPASQAIIPGYRFEEQIQPGAQTMLVVWRADHTVVIPEKIVSYLERVWNLSPDPSMVTILSNSQLYLPESPVKLGTMRLSLSTANIPKPHESAADLR